MRDIVLASLEDLRRYDAEWVRLCPNAEAHPATFEAVCRANPDLIRPHVALIERAGRVAAMAIARIQWERVPARFGLTTVASPSLRVVRVSYQGVSGDPDLADQLAAALYAPLLSGEADALFLDHAETGSIAARIGQDLPASLLRDPAPIRETIHWVADLPASYSQYLAGLKKSKRHNLNQNRQRVENAFGTRVRFACLSQIDDFETMVRDTTRVAELTYHKSLGVSFADQFWVQPLYRSAMSEGLARCFLLYIDDKPVAFYHGFVWQRRFSGSMTGFDPAFSEYGVGKYVVQKAFEHLCNSPDVDIFDFGFGDSEYKRRFGTHNWTEIECYVFARRARPRAVATLRGAVEGAARASDDMLDRFGLRDKVKQVWWRRVTKRG